MVRTSVVAFSDTHAKQVAGVRNPAARNNMRAMRAGDLAFFYHSNCAVPGIAGVMRVVEEHSIDESAFDPTHPYYDPKSTRDKPKWELVKVEFVKKFDELITLRELKSFAEKGGALETMQMIRQGRLSVSSVQPAQWRFILDLAEEPHSLGHPEAADGYESDTDGETDVRDDGRAKTAGDTDTEPGNGVERPVDLDQENDTSTTHVNSGAAAGDGKNPITDQDDLHV
jgi:predicted RNA-binding protein with PUA-like domain